MDKNMKLPYEPLTYNAHFGVIKKKNFSLLQAKSCNFILLQLLMFSDLVKTWTGAQTNTPSKSVARSNSLKDRVWEVPTNTEKKKSLKKAFFCNLACLYNKHWQSISYYILCYFKRNQKRQNYLCFDTISK